MADQGWRDRPRVMSRDIIEATAARIGEHARDHRIAVLDVVLHGGEPLLAGPEVLAGTVRAVRAAVGRESRTRFAVQTNGVRLDDRFLRTFAELRVSVGISLDGDRTAQDRHRRRPDGGGSHHLVEAALDRLTAPAYRHLFAGLLCTIDLANDPIGTYEALAARRPPMIDFLLPHGNWTDRPPHRPENPAVAPYADWLIEIFDHWCAQSAPVGVRMFEEIMNGLLGGRSGLDGIGTSPTGTVVVETDGSIECGDTIKSAYAGAGRTGLHVSRDSFDAASGLPLVRIGRSGAAGLAARCRACDLVQVCGGGLLAHRYRGDGGFDRPSVYCPDLMRLIGHIRDTLVRDLPAVGPAR